MYQKYVLSIDQGTTGSRVIIFNHRGEIVNSAYHEIKQYYPKLGWMEHDPQEYIKSIEICGKEALQKSGISAEQIEAIGITNQRETIVLWDKETGKPVYNAIVWYCKRTSDYCNDLKSKGLEKIIKEKTGLVLDTYFSASKIKWIIDNIDGVKEKIKKGTICMGNLDSWIIWNLSGGKYHVTDYSNASMTMLLNIHTLDWDDELLEIFGIDRNIMPKLMPTSGIMAYTAKNSFLEKEIPISGVVGDLQSTLFGQCCYKTGMAKVVYGTGVGFIMNIGSKPVMSNAGLLTTVLCVMNKKIHYAMEGHISIGAAVIQWLRDGLKIINDAKECNIFAEKVADTGNVYFVPAFTGLCTPYWNSDARGLIIGITGGTTREHICRAAEESIAYQVKDNIDAIIADSGKKLKSLRVDGGATKSDFLMQFQSDILGIPVERPKVIEMAALGAAYLAGLGTGYWESFEDLEKNWELEKRYVPTMKESKRLELYEGWKRAVVRSFDWEQ